MQKNRGNAYFVLYLAGLRTIGGREHFEMSQPPKTKRRSKRRKSLRGRLGSGSWLGLLHPRSGEPCSFEEWKRAEIARIMEKDE